MRKYNDKPRSLFGLIKTILPIYVAILTMVLVVYTIYYKQRKEIFSFDILYKSEQIEKNKEIIKMLESKIENLNKTIAMSPESISEIAIKEKLIKFEKRIDDIDQKTIALREAINPIKPEEMITIARLKDEVIYLRKRMDEIYDIMRREQDNFRSAVARELDASGRSTYLIVAILIPLALTFAYTVWKDRREKKKE